MENFMNRLKKEIDKGVTIVGAKSKEILETTKIKNRISDLNNQKQQALGEIGKITYQMYGNPDYDGGAAIQDKCRLVAGIEEEIQHKEDELEQIRKTTDQSINKNGETARYWDVKPEETEIGPTIDITPTSTDNQVEKPTSVTTSAIAASMEELPEEANQEPEGETQDHKEDCAPNVNVSETADSGTATPPPGPWKMLCETCYTIIDGESKFCSNCGTRLK
jgi:rRNA maturation endonuclease Nob1